MPDGTVQTFFTLGNEFTFPSGLTSGKYHATLYVNSIEVTKLDFKVTVPLLQNPFFYAVLATLIIIVFYQLFQYRTKKQELERSMLENRLQLLKKNLDPHFIFNSLNLTYMLLLQENNKEAIDSIIRFSDLHRYFLEMINQKEIPLTEELKFIKNYLELEQKRVYLDAPFSYAISEYDENASKIMIPPMILHPLVENAVKYCGYDPDKSTEAKIQIGLIITSQQAVIRIENSLGTTVSAYNVGFKRGVEIVRETISIYNKMGQHRIDFHPNLPSKQFQPGFLCELIIKVL
jgi:LytS/YehU family sensor histidine kinase